MYQLKINKSFNIAVERLFTAWSQAELLSQWFCPDPSWSAEATADCVECGKYRIAMRSPEGEEHIVFGQYLEVVKNEKLVFNWQWQSSEHQSKVEVLFFAEGDNASRLELIHSEFADKESCDKHHEGWTGCLSRLTNQQANF